MTILDGTSVNLSEAQDNTLSTPRRRYGLLAQLLFGTMDLFYGRKRTLSKFLEEIVQKKQIRENFFLHRIVPQFMAFFITM